MFKICLLLFYNCRSFVKLIMYLKLHRTIPKHKIERKDFEQAKEYQMNTRIHLNKIHY